MDITRHLQGLEETLLQNSVRNNPMLVSDLLSEGFREFGASGQVFSRQEILQALKAETSARLSLSEFTAVELADGLYLATYRSERTGEDGQTREALRSSIWRRDAEVWRLLFHQGTVVPFERQRAETRPLADERCPD